jgi:nicotinamide mononucleotide adenylyltransferase
VTTAEDEHLSSSRSKRLLSGYLFGDPHANDAAATSRQHSPTISALDSPPVTEADEGDLQPSFGQTGEVVGVDGPNVQSGGRAGPGKRAQGTDNGSPDQSSRRSSKSRDRESGWDALNGLNDGEADLDETAPQGEGGTEDYLSGMKKYCFPRHRLRTSMKGEVFKALGLTNRRVENTSRDRRLRILLAADVSASADVRDGQR